MKFQNITKSDGLLNPFNPYVTFRRIKASIVNKRIFIFIFTTMMLLVPQLSEAQVTVTGTAIWGNGGIPVPTGANLGVIVDGGDLTINGVTLTIDPTAEIIVRNGGVLTANAVSFDMGSNSKIEIPLTINSHMTFSACDFTTQNSATWKGIWLEQSAGHNGKLGTQWTTEPTDGNGNCTSTEWAGVLSVGEINTCHVFNCTFENAEIALQSHSTGLYDNGGAVIRVRESNFLNCEKGVRIANYDMGNISASHIMTCDFSWDDNLIFGTTELAHIEFSDLVQSFVRVGGCNFDNQRTTLDDRDNSGIGINAFRSDLSCTYDGDECCDGEPDCPDNCFDNTKATRRRNTFNLLGYGIKSIGGITQITTGNYTSYHHPKLVNRYSDFDNCIIGVYLEGSRDAGIGDNTFDIVKNDIDNHYPTGTSTSSNIKDIWHYKSSGVRIFSNVFTHDLEWVVSVRSDDPDVTQTSFIRENKFDNQFGVSPLCGPQIIGIDLHGDNDYLDITCNEFIEQVYDIKVNDGATLNDVPDTYVHNGSEKYNRNDWSNIPVMNNPSITDFKWKTLGCASNIYNETSFTTIIHDRYDYLGTDNMRFESFSFPQMDLNDAITPSCNASGGSGCVDCSVACDDLGIKQTGELGSVHDDLNNGLVKLYPNPAKNEFKVSMNPTQFEKGSQLNLYDTNGKLIFSAVMQSNQYTLNVNELNITPGLYLVHITYGKSSSNAKLLIE